MNPDLPYLCVGFDGVISSNASGWKGIDKIPDDPVPGAMDWLYKMIRNYNVCIYSSRSKEPAGLQAMQRWIWHHDVLYKKSHYVEPNSGGDGLAYTSTPLVTLLLWPEKKPAAFLTIDDRCICFDGNFPNLETIQNFKPWNKKGV